MGNKILLFTENHFVIPLVSYIMKNENIDIKHTTDKYQVKSLIKNDDIIVTILDFPKPQVIDFEYWRELLQETIKPILLISSDSSNPDRILMQQNAILNIGKPLVGLINNIKNENTRIFNIEYNLAENVSFDLNRHCVIKKGECFTLTIREFKLLYALLQNKGKISKNEELMEIADLAESSSLYMCIKVLREKIEEDSKHPTILINKRGQGYLLKDLQLPGSGSD